VSEDAALQQLRTILARPEFQSNLSQPFWDQILAPVKDFLLTTAAQLVELVSDAFSGRDGILGMVALSVAGVVLVLGGTYLVRTIQLAVTRETRVRTATLAERRQRSDELWHESERLAAGGRLEEAARAAYLSALYALDEHAVLHVQQGLTNREHARRLEGDHPRLAGLFLELVDRYDRVRYGRADITPETFTELRRLVGSARDGVLRSGVAA